MKAAWRSSETVAGAKIASPKLKSRKPKTLTVYVQCNRCRLFLRLQPAGCLPVHRGFSESGYCSSSLTLDFIKPDLFSSIRSNASLLLKGTRTQHEAWEHLFAKKTHDYVARKGITTDANGIFFVRVLEQDKSSGLCKIENDPTLGKREDVARVSASVEGEHLFPLLRGRGVAAFKVQADPDYSVLVPQRGMHGDPALPVDFPATYRFLKRFRSVLEQRSSLRRFQKKQVWWSLWSTGAYSFVRYKVAWREMPGGRFAAAIVSPIRHPHLGTKLVVLDHKLYFVPCRSLKEAAFLTALLNAPIVSEAISAYASQLSLGVSVVEYLALPQFDAKNSTHKALVSLALGLTRKVNPPSSSEWSELDSLAHTAFRLP